MTSRPFATIEPGLIAILRGIKHDETDAIVDALVEAGFMAIEIPLNSPDPFNSIARAVKRAPQGCLIGAGTVLTPDQVDKLADIGGRLVISPNVDPDVIARTSHHGMISMPGVFTPTEALAACAAGASALKFFPASLLGPSSIKAIGSVLPADMPIGAVGGVSENDFAAYGAVGVKLFGLGSSLYKPGLDAACVLVRARAAVKAHDDLSTGSNAP